VRRGLLLALALLVAAPAPEAAAQDRVPRKWLFAGFGAALGLGLTAVYTSGEFNTNIGWCTSAKCVGIVSTTFAAFVGFMVGREVDNHYAERYRAAPPVSLAARTRSLRTRATTLTLDRDLVAAFGDDGVELVSAAPTLDYVGHRAAGLRDVTDAAVDGPARHLLVGTTTGLYLYALSGEAPGTRVLAGELAAVAPRGDRVAVATASALRVGTMGPDPAGAPDSITWRPDSVTWADRVTDLRWRDDTLLWVLSESALWAYRVPRDGEIGITGRADLPGTLRRLAVSDTLAVVAAGAEGVYLLHVGDPAAPRELAHWSEPRYAYDAALWGDVIAVAAGPEGLYLLELGPDGLRPLGLERDAGFVSAVAAAGGALYAIDRNGGVIRHLALPGREPR
jgi:hypothetical protein